MRFFSYLLKLNPKKRLILLIAIDVILFSLALFFSSYWFPDQYILDAKAEGFLKLRFVYSFTGVTVFLITGQYKGLTRFVGSNSIYILVFRNALISGLAAFFCELINIETPGLKYWILVWLFTTSLNTSTRLLLRDILRNNFAVKVNNSKKKLSRIAIYGAGEAGDQLAQALKISNKYIIQFFLDDSAYLFKRKLKGIAIFSTKDISKFKDQIDQVFLAIPSLTRKRKREIFQKFNKYGISILEVPALEEIASGAKRIESVRTIKIEDLLGRDTVNPDPKLYGPSITNKNVFVTGAGGSIGMELCTQIIKLNPASLVIIDNSEPSLYKVNQKISSQNDKFINLRVVLGDVNDKGLIETILSEENIDIVFHAAAYKHVPLVELNPITALKNNVFSTYVICKNALKYKIPKVILISSDKAVRPSNIMGASKRLSEMILQAYADTQNNYVGKDKNTFTNFSMVRFGNVLGSSGSVVPLFKEQILNGGPITVTHPDVVRYFMTISEAAQLVIQASELTLGGDLFLLDMGQPVLIKDLAEQMIKLFGLKVKNDQNLNGDIEILFTGLRPGEKLFEELLINAKSQPTNHPLIYKANEESIISSELWEGLKLLEKFLKDNDKVNALLTLKSLIPEWKNK